MRSEFEGHVHYDVIPDVGREVVDATDAAPCPMHPEWRPKRWLPNQPRAPLACPHCRADKVEALAREHDGPVRVEHPQYPKVSAVNERMQAAFTAYEERQVQDGNVQAGSAEEEAALAAIDAARDQERADIKDTFENRRARLHRHWASVIR